MAVRKRGETASAKPIIALMELEGVTKAARMLGVAPGTLHRARNSGVASKPLVVAAEGLMQKLRKGLSEAELREPVRQATERLLDRTAEKLAEVQPAPQPAPEPPPTVEPRRRAMMLLEGTERELRALQNAAEFFKVKAEIEVEE